jgi:predicted DNA-binding WGR domain protein
MRQGCIRHDFRSSFEDTESATFWRVEHEGWFVEERREKNVERTVLSRASLIENWGRICDQLRGQEEVGVTSKEVVRPVTFAILGARSETRPRRFVDWAMKHWRNC